MFLDHNAHVCHGVLIARVHIGGLVCTLRAGKLGTVLVQENALSPVRVFTLFKSHKAQLVIRVPDVHFSSPSLLLSSLFPVC